MFAVAMLVLHTVQEGGEFYDGPAVYFDEPQVTTSRQRTPFAWLVYFVLTSALTLYVNMQPSRRRLVDHVDISTAWCRVKLSDPNAVSDHEGSTVCKSKKTVLLGVLLI